MEGEKRKMPCSKMMSTMPLRVRHWRVALSSAAASGWAGASGWHQGFALVSTEGRSPKGPGSRSGTGPW